MEKTAERRYQTVKAFIEALRDVVGAKSVEPEVTARGAAIYVEIRIGDGADAESDEVLDDTSAILDATEHSLRGAGMTLPLQTGSAIIGARVLSADAAQGRRASATRPWRWRKGWRRSWQPALGARRRPRQHRRSRRRRRSSRTPRTRPGGKEVVGGELLSTADWAPQQSVDGVHLTDAARR